MEKYMHQCLLAIRENLIEILAEFKDGKVINYGAKKEQDVLKSLVEFDEGSCYLGEVALISYDSPIKKYWNFIATIPYLMRMHPASGIGRRLSYECKGRKLR